MAKKNIFDETEKYIKKELKKHFPDFEIKVEFYQIAMWDTRYDIDFDKKVIEFGVYYGALRYGALHLKEIIPSIRNAIKKRESKVVTAKEIRV